MRQFYKPPQMIHIAAAFLVWQSLIFRSSSYCTAGVYKFYWRMYLNWRRIWIFDQFDQFCTGVVTESFGKLSDSGQRHDDVDGLHVAEAADGKILRHFYTEGVEV